MLIKSLDQGTKAAPDGIPLEAIEIVADVIVSHLANIINKITNFQKIQKQLYWDPFIGKMIRIKLKIIEQLVFI